MIYSLFGMAGLSSDHFLVNTTMQFCANFFNEIFRLIEYLSEVMKNMSNRIL
ncbi:unnamed protein product [Cylicocyclus nassatus]|uniref:Uncharacterized protein n=1 Tax=Cylicocyclus nassatus TaxID=53992 RepID=A0AA36HBL3_CYLNA|nr:unnamed protein product [Cylicocyclus nassatus]